MAKKQKDRLAAKDWLAGAFRALTSGGPAAIKAEAIARDLGVSKGSFYWHFADVPTLKSNMLAHWEQTATESIIVELEQASGSAHEKLRQLMALSTSGLDNPYGGPLAEPAIRDWSRYDEAVGAVVKRVDAARIRYVEDLLRQTKLSNKQSKRYAALLYSTLVGSQILSEHKLANPKILMPELLELLLD